MELPTLKEKMQGFFSWLVRPKGLFCPIPKSRARANLLPLYLIITTGTITHVGEAHIEHNVNTVGGHSGALVVVNDPGHAYHGKAIAIHAGYNAELGQNIAFKLQGMSFE